MSLDADVVVVGTGAGGATVARALAGRGLDVLMLEEGPDLRGRMSEPTARDSMLARFRGFGAQLASGRIPLIQGRLVGGSTAINSAIFWRLPEAVYADWAAADPALGRALPWADLMAATDEIEADLFVRPVAEGVMGRNNQLLRQGAQALGLAGNVIRRAESGCEGSGRCMLGCPNQRRQGMEVGYVPQAIARGARLQADARALKIRWKGHTAVGLDAIVGGRRVAVHARKGVVLSAGAIHSPWLLLNSGVRAGQRFTAHPGFSVAGIFDEEVGLLRGATQGYEVTALRAQGLKFEALGLPAGLTTARLPGAGAAFKQLADRAGHLASWGCLFRPEGVGAVKKSLLGGPTVTLPVSAADCARILTGVKTLIALFFAAGARRVLPGIAGAPAVISSPAEFTVDRLTPSQVSLVATHLFGGAIVGSDPSRSVVDPRFAVHGTKGLFVADASVLPGTLGVNPQGSIMAVARVAADRIADQLQQVTARAPAA